LEDGADESCSRAGLRLVAAHDMPAAFSKAHGNMVADFALGGAIRTKRPVQITDLAATREYGQRHPKLVEAVELGAFVPPWQPIGVVAIHRPEVANVPSK
jgi:hypothetical protein